MSGDAWIAMIMVGIALIAWGAWVGQRRQIGVIGLLVSAGLAVPVVMWGGERIELLQWINLPLGVTMLVLVHQQATGLVESRPQRSKVEAMMDALIGSLDRNEIHEEWH